MIKIVSEIIETMIMIMVMMLMVVLMILYDQIALRIEIVRNNLNKNPYYIHIVDN